MKKLTLLDRIGVGAGILGAAISADADTLYCDYNELKTDTLTAYVSSINPSGLPEDAPVDYQVLAQATFSSIEQPDGSFKTPIYLNDNLAEQYVWVTATRDGVESPRSKVVSRILDSVAGDSDAPITFYAGLDENGDYLFASDEAFCIGGDKRTFFEPNAGVVSVPKEYFENSTSQFASLAISDSQDNVGELNYAPWTFGGNVEDFYFDKDSKTVDMTVGGGLEGYLEAEFPTSFNALPSDISGASLDNYLMGVPLKADNALSDIVININDGVSDLSYYIPSVKAGGDLALIDLANDVYAGNPATFDWTNADSFTITIPDDGIGNHVEMGEVFYTGDYGVLTNNLLSQQYVTAISEDGYSSGLSAILPRRSTDYNPTSIASNVTDDVAGSNLVAGIVELTDSEYANMGDSGVTVVLGQGIENISVNIPKSKLEAGVNLINGSMGDVEMSSGFDANASCDSHFIKVNAALSSRSASTIGKYAFFSTASD